LSKWDYNSERFPDAVKLADGQIISISDQDRQAKEWEVAQRYPRSQATYTAMDKDGIVRVRFASGGIPQLSAGNAWAKLEVIAPKTAIWLYGGRCADCSAEMGYSEDVESSGYCEDCQAQIDWQEVQSERDAEAMAEVREERRVWMEAQ
jgi:hypothetical protein